MNWLGDEALAVFAASGDEILARIRSSGPLQPATLSLDEDGIAVDLAYGEDGVSPGQACVFYRADDGGERLLGGGWIKSARAEARPAKDGFAHPAAKGGAERTLAAVSR